jgi:hypothetical protein
MLFSLLFLILNIFIEFIFLQGNEISLELNFLEELHNLLVVPNFVVLQALERLFSLFEGKNQLRMVLNLRNDPISLTPRQRTHFIDYRITFPVDKRKHFLFYEFFLVFFQVIDERMLSIWELLFNCVLILRLISWNPWLDVTHRYLELDRRLRLNLAL